MEKSIRLVVDNSPVRSPRSCIVDRIPRSIGEPLPAFGGARLTETFLFLLLFSVLGASFASGFLYLLYLFFSSVVL